MTGVEKKIRSLENTAYAPYERIKNPTTEDWKAVTDAREKAAVLTSAAGVALKDIQSIDYSWGEINFEYRPMNKGLLLEDAMCAPGAAMDSYEMDIEPDDIEVSDTVTVIWEVA